MKIYNIIEEINLENGSNYKMSVLKKYQNNELLKKILKMTYDKVSYTYGITMKNIKYTDRTIEYSLEEAIQILEDFYATRKITGNKAIEDLSYMFSRLSSDDQKVLKGVINRDLRINMGRSNINKVFKNLIVKPVYNRCAVGHHDMVLPNGKTKKSTFRKITYPAVVNLKADGTFRSCEMDNGASFLSRPGQPYTYPEFEKVLQDENGTLNGEMTVILDDELLDLILPKLKKADIKDDTHLADDLVKRYNKSKELNQEFILDRGLGNGLLNSDDVPEKNIVYDVWDLITQEDIKLAVQKDKKNPPKESYKIRFAKLQELVKRINHPRIRLIEFREVNSLKEAMDFTIEKMEMGLEGAILKDWSMLVKDGTNDLQLKLKLKVDADVRVTGFIEGKKGTKRELTFGSLMFETDDRMIRGSTSGFSDDLLEEINSNRKFWIGQIISVEFNDLSIGRGNNFYALSHPRFIERRDDKKETDTIERVLESVEMAKGLHNV